MPRLNGREVHEAALHDRPSLKVLYMSGYASDVIGHHGVVDEGVSFLQKPFSADALREKVQLLLAPPPAAVKDALWRS